MSEAQPKTLELDDGKGFSNFIYLRTFPGSQDLWYTYVTCNPSEPGLHKIVEKGHDYSESPSPGYYMASKLLFTENDTPSFFYSLYTHKGPEPYKRVPNMKYLKLKYLVVWALDDSVDVQPLDLAGGSPEMNLSFRESLYSALYSAH